MTSSNYGNKKDLHAFKAMVDHEDSGVEGDSGFGSHSVSASRSEGILSYRCQCTMTLKITSKLCAMTVLFLSNLIWWVINLCFVINTFHHSSPVNIAYHYFYDHPKSSTPNNNYYFWKVTMTRFLFLSDSFPFSPHPDKIFHPMTEQEPRLQSTHNHQPMKWAHWHGSHHNQAIRRAQWHHNWPIR